MDENEDVTNLNYTTVYNSEYECQLPCPMTVLKKLIQLQKKEMTKKNVHRQLLLMDDFLAAYTTPFFLSDLPLIMEFAEKILVNVADVPQFQIPLQLFLEKARQLPLLKVSSEKLTYIDTLCEYFDFWAHFLLETHYEEILHHITCILVLLLKCEPGICPNAITKNMVKIAVEKSLIPRVIARLLIDADDNYYKLLLQVTNELAHLTPSICDVMVKESTMLSLIMRLDPNYRTRGAFVNPDKTLTAEFIPNLELSLKIIWQLLSGIENFDTANYPLLNQKIWGSFEFAFLILVNDQRAKLERNSLTACLLKSFVLFPGLSFYGTKFPDDFCNLFVCMDMGSVAWSTNIRHSKEILDYKFKKMMLLSIGFLAKNGVIEPIRQREVLKTLIEYIDPGLNANWKSLQHTNLFHMILNVCIFSMPHLVDDFIQFNGPITLLNTINYYIMHNYVVEILMNCLRLVWMTLLSNNNTVIEIFRDNGIILILTEIGDMFLEKPNFTTIKQDCLTYSFLIIEILIQNNSDHQIDVITFSLKYLLRTLKPHPEDTFHNSKVLIACISCLWDCIKNNEENLKYFVTNKGVYILLDTIEKSSHHVQIIGLGMLVDLCEDETCIPYVLTWRKFGKRYMTLLLNIVRKENKKLEVKMTNSGVIEDIYQPLMGQRQYLSTYDRKKEFDSSPAIMDMYASARPKVYAIIQLIRRHENIVDIINERYKIQTYEHSIQDQITMLLIENFLALKLGEVWTEVGNDIKALGTQLLGIDENLITTLCMRLPNMALYIKNLQIKLLQTKNAKETMKEKEMYNKINDARLGASLEAMSDLHYIARTTESIFRMIQKMRQRSYIDNANLPSSQNTEHHNTFQYNINVNPVFNQHIIINTYVDKKLIQTIKEVSPSNSIENLFECKDEEHVSLIKME